MRGNITRRGKNSWRIRYDAGLDADGKRVQATVTIRGTRQAAQTELAKRLHDLNEGRYVAPTVETVGTYAEHWIQNIAPATRQAVTCLRYQSIIRAHILPVLGDVPLQKLDGSVIDRFYASRRKAGLSEMTLHHVSTLLGAIIKSAVKAKKLVRSPMTDTETKPKPKAKRVDVLDESEVAALLDPLKGHWLYMPVLLTAYTGMRRGEVLGLRWRDIDFTKGTLTVAQAVERITGAPSLKEPKTDRSRRTIKLPADLLPALTAHRKAQAEYRLAHGLGKDALGLVFTSPRGKLIDPEVLSQAFSEAVEAAGVRPITFHALRHTHITHLLRAGVPVHIVSARAGHSKASVTLDTYSHLMTGDDDAAADLANDMLRRALN